jgi:hypothetical protein
VSECCSAKEVDETPASRCARCMGLGTAVDLLTIRVLLTDQALGRLQPGRHRFCPEPICDVVYFDERGAVFTTADLRVAVWQKERPGLRTICYCFGENERGIQAEVDGSGQSDAVGRVRQHIAAGRCACEVRNPRGVCCLGDLVTAVKRAMEAAHGTSQPTPSSAKRRRLD